MTMGGPLVRGPLSLNSKKKKNDWETDFTWFCISRDTAIISLLVQMYNSCRFQKFYMNLTKIRSQIDSNLLSWSERGSN